MREFGEILVGAFLGVAIVVALFGLFLLVAV